MNACWIITGVFSPHFSPDNCPGSGYIRSQCRAPASLETGPGWIVNRVQYQDGTDEQPFSQPMQVPDHFFEARGSSGVSQVMSWEWIFGSPVTAIHYFST